MVVTGSLSEAKIDCSVRRTSRTNGGHRFGDGAPQSLAVGIRIKGVLCQGGLLVLDALDVLARGAEDFFDALGNFLHHRRRWCAL